MFSIEKISNVMNLECSRDKNAKNQVIIHKKLNNYFMTKNINYFFRFGRTSGGSKAFGVDGRIRHHLPHPDGHHVHRVGRGHRRRFHHHLRHLSSKNMSKKTLEA